MRLLGLALKNARRTWWRTLTLGFLVFSVSFVIIMFDAAGSAIRDTVEGVLVNAVTGHVQVRSGDSYESDMVEQFSDEWDSLKPVEPEVVAAVESEVGTLRAIGYSRHEVIRLFMAEIFTTATIGFVLGATGAVAIMLAFGPSGIPAPGRELAYIMGDSLVLQPNGGRITSTFVVVAVFTLASSFVPAYRACSVSPSEALRAI